MKIGIVSDSHGMARRLRAALGILTSGGVDAIVHCGDIGSIRCLELLGAVGVPIYAVAGNMDRHIERLESAAAERNVTFSWEVVEVPIGGDRFLVAAHGHDERILGGLLAGQQFPYVCHGHTHCTRDERIGKVRLINPGALCRPRSPGGPTAAILDTDKDELEIVKVAGGAA